MTTVGEAVGQTLKAYGTEYFFCFCGGDHELWYGLEQVGIRIINCRSEAGADQEAGRHQEQPDEEGRPDHPRDVGRMLEGHEDVH